MQQRGEAAQVDDAAEETRGDKLDLGSEQVPGVAVTEGPDSMVVHGAGAAGIGFEIGVAHFVQKGADAGA